VAYYIDTSALVKLVVAETETKAFRSWLAQEPRWPVACDLVRTELLRTIRRAAPDRVVRAREVLDALTLMDVPTAVFEEAGRLQPPELRFLDALRLAAALDLGDDLEGIVTYDERLALAAESMAFQRSHPLEILLGPVVHSSVGEWSRGSPVVVPNCCVPSKAYGSDAMDEAGLLALRESAGSATSGEYIAAVLTPA